MKRKLKLLILSIMLVALFLPTKTDAYESLDDKKIQILLTGKDWTYPEITSNMNLNFPYTSAHGNWGVTYWKGASNVKWVMKSGTQPNIKLKYPKIIKVNNVEYDFIFHYYKVDWCTSTHYLSTIAGAFGSTTNEWSPYTAGKGDANNLRVGTGEDWIPAFEYNPTPLDYATYGHSRTHNPKIYTKIEIRNSETGEFANIPELAFCVSDIDTINDGFQYVGSPLTHVYQNKNGSTVNMSQHGEVYTFHSGGNYDYEDDDGPADNKGTVFIQSADIAKGEFEIRSDFNATDRNSHIKLGGVMFIGSAADVVYISDNTNDDLSNYNEHFVGTNGQPINYRDKAKSIAELKQRGFVVVRDDFGSGKNFTDGKKTYEIHVEYRPQQAKTVFIDKTNNNALIGERAILMGVPGENIVDSGYKTSGSINTQILLDRGYKLVSDEYTTNPKFDDVQGNIQEIKVILEHTYTTVDKDTYEPKKCLNKACTAEQPEKGC